MKILQFNLSDFNPDAMNTDEIKQWIDFIGRGVKPQVAKQWFPGVRGQFQHARNVRNYLWNKLTAMNLRLEGKIDTAIKYEEICERIYKVLPHSAQW